MFVWSILLSLYWFLGPTGEVIAQPPPTVCYAEEKVWIPGYWVYRRGCKTWQPGYWEVRRVRVPCPPPPCPPPPRCDPYNPYYDPYSNAGPIMQPGEFARALQAVRARNFDDSRLTLAQQIVATNWLTSLQVRELLSAFSFDQNRLALAKTAWHRVVDPQQYYIVHEAFTFDSSTQELDFYIRANPR